MELRWQKYISYQNKERVFGINIKLGNGANIHFRYLIRLRYILSKIYREDEEFSDKTFSLHITILLIACYSYI